MTESFILLRDVLPQAPAAAGSDFGITNRRMMMIAVDRTFGAAAVGNEYQIILGQRNGLLLSVYLALDGGRNLLTSVNLK